MWLCWLESGAALLFLHRGDGNLFQRDCQESDKSVYGCYIATFHDVSNLLVSPEAGSATVLALRVAALAGGWSGSSAPGRAPRTKVACYLKLVPASGEHADRSRVLSCPSALNARTTQLLCLPFTCFHSSGRKPNAHSWGARHLQSSTLQKARKLADA